VADYARAGIPMLPVVAGPVETRRQIPIYAVALAPIGASLAVRLCRLVYGSRWRRAR
jgi:heme O synthase-like polyprenyltransferase